MNDHKGYKDETQITIETIQDINKRFVREKTGGKPYDAAQKEPVLIVSSSFF
jgi:hypothetical protein